MVDFLKMWLFLILKNRTVFSPIHYTAIVSNSSAIILLMISQATFLAKISENTLWTYVHTSCYGGSH